ncbi:hypothetical protein THAOC_37685 [Thalassiosira oceanica]|uniref:Uncharacterized protein n=1 Tax=Thalassiosira oceanica TaxID=159749 RepID=K0RBG5_THAOC|nr:hypothetical protein THAOC_37685 [Thalassiosira oceanica]|eukprot:EJK43832.1 hypothetical protein THAOC_37685 [Thalassiosira oceanica]
MGNSGKSVWAETVDILDWKPERLHVRLVNQFQARGARARSRPDEDERAEETDDDEDVSDDENDDEGDSTILSSSSSTTSDSSSARRRRARGLRSDNSEGVVTEKGRAASDPRRADGRARLT